MSGFDINLYVEDTYFASEFADARKDIELLFREFTTSNENQSRYLDGELEYSELFNTILDYFETHTEARYPNYTRDVFI